MRSSSRGGNQAGRWTTCCQTFLTKWGVVPAEGFEPPTNGLQNRCSTPELSRRGADSTGWLCDGFDPDAGERLEAVAVVVAEVAGARAVEVEHAEQLAAVQQRHDDLRARRAVAGDVARECVDVG